MKNKRMLYTVCLLILLTGCTQHSLNQSNATNSKDTAQVSSGSWSVDKLIMFNKNVYTGSDDKVPVSEVEEQIGVIEKSSDDETAAIKENFSNYYPVGTKLYKIKNYSTQDAIAIEVNKDTYVFAKKNKD